MSFGLEGEKQTEWERILDPYRTTETVHWYQQKSGGYLWGWIFAGLGEGRGMDCWTRPISSMWMSGSGVLRSLCQLQQLPGF